MVLKQLKADASTKLGYEVTECVITCPAYFNEAQRSSTKEAARIADLNVLNILNEPTAAALSYCVGKKNMED